MDIVTYSILKKLIKGVSSGITGHSLNGTTLTINFVDGTTQRITFPTPKDGTDGVDGIGITSAEKNADGELIISFSDDTSVNVGNIVGPQGEKGDTGATGPRGLRGIQGEKGDTGEGFAISKLYDTQADLLADTEPVADGLFVAVLEPTVNVYMHNTGTVETDKDLADYKFVLNLEEASVIRGPQGETGAQGIPGVSGKDGKDGADGKDGKSITNAEINANGELLLTYSDDSTVNVGKVKGDKGDKGEGSEIDLSDYATKDELDNITVKTDTVLSDTSTNPLQNKVITEKFDEVFQSVSNGKSDLETAIADKGVTVSKMNDIATFEELCDGIESIEQEGVVLPKWMAWHNEKSMTIARCYTRGVSVGNKFYVMGGSVTNTNYCYDVETKTWSAKANIPVSGNFYLATVGKYIYIVGGWTTANNSADNCVYKYDTELNTWQSCTRMPSAMCDTRILTQGNYIYVLGGTGGGKRYNTLYRYNTETDIWETKANMPSVNMDINATIYKNKIYTFSGCGDVGSTSLISKNYVYDIENDVWSEETNIDIMPILTLCSGNQIIGSEFYVLGGFIDTTYQTLTNKVQCLDFETGKWTEKSPMKQARACFACGKISNIIFVACGNIDGNATATNTMESYIPQIDN